MHAYATYSGMMCMLSPPLMAPMFKANSCGYSYNMVSLENKLKKWLFSDII